MKLNGFSQNQVNNPAYAQTQNTTPIEQGAVSPAHKGAEAIDNKASQNIDALKQIYSDEELKKLGLMECET